MIIDAISVSIVFFTLDFLSINFLSSASIFDKQTFEYLTTIIFSLGEELSEASPEARVAQTISG